MKVLFQLGNSTALLPSAVALLPVIPLLGGFIAIMRFLGSMDELQRRIQLDAFAVAAGATALCTFAYAMLQGAGAPQIGFEWILPFIVVVWGFAAAIARLRYTR